MGKKREKINKAKESGKIQDQNVADEIENEMTTQVQAVNEKEYGKNFGSQELYDENYEEPALVQEDEKKNAAAMEMKQRKKALTEFRCRVEDAILGNYLLGKPNNHVCGKESTMAIEQLKEITLWGVPLMPSKRHGGTDTVLSKFLKAKDYNVDEAFEKLRKTLIWRKEFKADEILEESLGPDFEKAASLNSRDKEGRPLFYNVYGALKDKQMQHKIFGAEENCEKFLRWRVQCMEKCIKELNFEPGGADSLVQIIDWKNLQGPPTKELRSVYRKSWMLLEDHYPELIHRNIIINVPLWYYVSHVLSSRLKTQRTNSKIVFARPGKVTETLLKFIYPENLLVEYGGLKRENDTEFSSEDKASELGVRANTSEHIQIPAPEAGVTIVWDLTVVGWEVSYKEQFIPDDEGSYKVLIQQEKEKKGGGESVRNSFYINEPGKIVISIDNFMLKKKKVLYRYKTKPTVPMYLLFKK